MGGTYTEGAVLNVSITITAHHNGRFGFRVCRVAAPPAAGSWTSAEQAQMSNACLDQHVLTQPNTAAAQTPGGTYWSAQH